MGAIREPALYRCVAGYAAPYDLAKMYKWGSIRRSDLGMKYLERVLGKDKADLAKTLVDDCRAGRNPFDPYRRLYAAGNDV